MFTEKETKIDFFEHSAPKPKTEVLSPKSRFIYRITVRQSMYKCFWQFKTKLCGFQGPRWTWKRVRDNLTTKIRNLLFNFHLIMHSNLNFCAETNPKPAKNACASTFIWVDFILKVSLIISLLLTEQKNFSQEQNRKTRFYDYLAIAESYEFSMARFGIYAKSYVYTVIFIKISKF